MEENVPDTPTVAPVADDISRRLQEQRRRWDDYLHSQRKNFGQLESQISQQLESLVAQVAEAQAGSQQVRADLDHQASELERRVGELNERSSDLDRRQDELERRAAEIAGHEAEWQQKLDELTRRATVLDEQSKALEQLSAELDARAAEVDREIAAASATDPGQAEMVSELQAELAELRHRSHEAETARRAAEQEQQSAQAAATTAATELEAFRTALEKAREEINAARADADAARANAQTARADADAARTNAEAARADVEGARAETQAARAEFERFAAEPVAPTVDFDELDRLRIERDQLKVRLVDAHTKLADTQTKLSAGNQRAAELEDLQRRFEMAIQDVRELKAQNAELEDKVARVRRDGMTGTTPGGGNNFDWESQKRKMLASLDDDFDPNDEEDQKERQSIEDAVRISDQVVAQKDNEIAELRQLLENQTASLGSVAVGAAAVAAVLDQDELIAQERRRLVELENEWREKLRTAEVEMSVERAKIARERLSVQDDRAALEEQQKKLRTADGGAGVQDTGKKGGRQWLRRLGIRETDTNR